MHTQNNHHSSSKVKPNYWLHPFEISFAAYSGAGKTTLIEKIIAHFSANYSIGYLKHDAHNVVLDTEGKDTWRAQNAGAQLAAIQSNQVSAVLANSINDFDLAQIFQNYDWLFIEGYKESFAQKLVLLDAQGKMWERLLKNELSNVQAIICQSSHQLFECKSERPDFEYFVRDDVASIAVFVARLQAAKIPPIYGLVLAGGKSKRMGVDKATIQYHEHNQAQWTVKLLERFCTKVYLSRRADQNSIEEVENILFDKIDDVGPIGGIASAFMQTPQAAWFVVACDMPLLHSGELERLIKSRNPYRFATSLIDEKKGFAEPLASIYEPKIYFKLLAAMSRNQLCPTKLLAQVSIQPVQVLDANVLENANTQADLQNVLLTLNGRLP